jgi:hypothetical protein
VDAIEREGQGQIDPIIDKQHCIAALNQREESPCQLIQIPTGEVLFAELNGSRPSPNGAIDHRLKWPTPGLRAVGDDIESP